MRERDLDQIRTVHSLSGRAGEGGRVVSKMVGRGRGQAWLPIAMPAMPTCLN